MGTNSYTTADLANITKALSQGLKKARLNGREVEYQSALQMRKVKADMEAQLNMDAELAGTRKQRPRSYRARCAKGL
jgi:hypothetical protein